MLQGIPPYRLAYNMKFPGVYAAYALIMWIFGQTSIGIHFGLLIVNIANIVIVFLIARRLIGLIAGIAAAASYTILSASPSVLGLAAHATHFVMLPTLLGALVLLKPVLTKKMVFVSGIFFGAGLLMKQPAIFFICFGAAYLLFRDWRAKFGFNQMLLRSAVFIAASALPLPCAPDFSLVHIISFLIFSRFACRSAWIRRAPPIFAPGWRGQSAFSRVPSSWCARGWRCLDSCLFCHYVRPIRFE